MFTFSWLQLHKHSKENKNKKRYQHSSNDIIVRTLLAQEIHRSLTISFFVQQICRERESEECFTIYEQWAEFTSVPDMRTNWMLFTFVITWSSSHIYTARGGGVRRRETETVCRSRSACCLSPVCRQVNPHNPDDESFIAVSASSHSDLYPCNVDVCLPYPPPTLAPRKFVLSKHLTSRISNNKGSKGLSRATPSKFSPPFCSLLLRGVYVVEVSSFHEQSTSYTQTSCLIVNGR